ncbi:MULTISPECIES: hypothetical protein [unclassified Nocardiopsis]|uniref:hypothetical protein n=1 Tax=unclassified Nocardiopsis TaxID=2649073 RepID=UPI00066EAFD4|nr:MULTISPECIES: hypothetical protein [unclassified Nocardiopsis]MBQ1082152.1 hypothetical protein [Nocardiopsis sp. B62]
MATIVSIDTDALIDMRGSLGRIQSAFAEAEEGDSYRSPEDRAEDIGPGNLVDKAKDYGKDCKKNYERQAEDLGALLQALTPVIETFEEADTELGTSLSEDKSAPAGPPPPGHPNQSAV